MGAAYQRAVINDAGDGPARDVMSGVHALQSQGNIDEYRLAVSGWSYGGFLTAWLTAHEHIWRAAVAGAAVSSWVDWYNLADLNVWCGIGLDGSPWREGGLEHYLNNSAIAYRPAHPHAYAPDEYDRRSPRFDRAVIQTVSRAKGQRNGGLVRRLSHGRPLSSRSGS